VARAEHYQAMRDLHGDDDRRRAYLYTQAMFQSLEDAAAIS
jgi:hypothetical protein